MIRLLSFLTALLDLYKPVCVLRDFRLMAIFTIYHDCATKWTLPLVLMAHYSIWLY